MTLDLLVEGVPLVLGLLLREFCHSGYIEYLTRCARRSKCARSGFDIDGKRPGCGFGIFDMRSRPFSY